MKNISKNEDQTLKKMFGLTSLQNFDMTGRRRNSRKGSQIHNKRFIIREI